MTGCRARGEPRRSVGGDREGLRGTFGVVGGDQRGRAGPDQGPRLVHQRGADIAGRSGQEPSYGSERGRGVVVGGHPGVIGRRRGGFTLRPTPGEVAEWLKALAC